MRYFNILSRPDVSIKGIAEYCRDVKDLINSTDEETVEQAEILMKYEGYIEREKENADKLKRLEDLKLKPDFNYDVIASLGTEAKEKLNKFKPNSIGQASRISGINPADISVLLVHMGR
jgi:tRNA uridine 5-carboxymethylaminomethyl modification enzyme